MRDLLLGVRRLGAFLFDLTFLWCVLEVVIFVRTVFEYDTPRPMASLWASVFIAVYFVLFEAFGNGQTPGKRICRVAVVDYSGARVAVPQSIIRVMLLMFIPLSLGLLSRLVSELFYMPDRSVELLDDTALFASVLIWPVTATLTRCRVSLHDFAARTAVVASSEPAEARDINPKVFVLTVSAVFLFAFASAAIYGLVVRPGAGAEGETSEPAEYDVRTAKGRGTQLVLEFVSATILDSPSNTDTYMHFVSRTIQSCRGHQSTAYFSNSVYSFLPDSVTNSAAGVKTCVSFYFDAEPRGITSTSFHEHAEDDLTHDLFSQLPDSVAYATRTLYLYRADQQLGFAALRVEKRRLGYWVRQNERLRFMIFDPDDSGAVSFAFSFSPSWVLGK